MLQCKKGSAAILESLDFRPSPLTTQLPASSQVSAPSTVVSFASSGSTMVSSTNSLPSQLSSPTSVNAQILPSSRSGTVSVPIVPPTPRASKSPTPLREKTPSHDETMGFLSSLATCSSKPAILSLVAPHSSRCVPKTLDSSLPMYLSELYKPEYVELNYGELVTLATNYTVSITEEQASLVEPKTKLQSNSH